MQHSPRQSYDYREYVRSIHEHFGETTDDRDRGFVYIAISTDEQRCKIGWSANPTQRVKRFTNFRLVHYFPGDRSMERGLHRKFAAYALGHERFRLEGDLLEFVSRLE
ncbi:GIY-YIG nuclease family protein [Leptolyngbya sp. AN03gr2]|uniref:GIY-YIG nuclease family protein n=1 Tax=unclassified Leptolyngbya TaxID=2650499 RepID=UPI003D31AF3A